MSRILYAASFIPPTQSLWQRLERIHRAGQHVALGFPSYSHIEATWTNAQDMPVSLRAKQRAMHPPIGCRNRIIIALYVMPF